MTHSHSKRSLRSRRSKTEFSLEALEARCLLAGDSVSEEPQGPMVDAPPFDPTSLVVRFRPDVIDEALSDLPRAFQATNRGFSLLPGLRELRLPRGISVAEAIEVYQSDARVLYAEPNYNIQLAATPNDPRFDALWALNNIGQTGGTVDADIDAAEAWDLHGASGNTVVAVLDTGVDWTHEDLAANMWVNPGEIPDDGIDNDGNGYVDDVHGYDFRNIDSDPMDDNNHGTHVAGTIAAVGNNGVGVTGINWNAQIMALKFISDSGSGGILDAVEALNYAVDNGARISNNSWGYNGGSSQALDDAIRSARDAGHIFVAAAGNGALDNDTDPFWPANHDYDNVVSVAATDHNDQKASFSSYGATTVDLGAPGVGIVSTKRGNNYGTSSGTSMAAPHVTGALAMLMDQNPSWSHQELVDRLLSSVDPIDALAGITVTGGRLNLAAALASDSRGPRVTNASPEGFVFEPFSSIRVTFDEAIDPATFSTDDVHGFTGPLGPINVTSVAPVAGSNGQKFDVTFPPQGEAGSYSLSLGPDITDLAGNPMNQDGDGTNGEPAADQFSYNVEKISFFAKIDLGTDTSPVADGYQRASSSTMYTPELGMGWLDATSQRDRGESYGSLVTRDFNFTEQATFVIDVPAESAVYDVTLTMGDGLANTPARDQMGVFLEGVQFDSVTSQPGEFVTSTYRVTVSDGQLTLGLDDLGGSDPYVMLNAIQVDMLGPDTAGPQVMQAEPSEVLDFLDDIALTFNEAIDASSFTVADVVTLAGPNGPISVSAVDAISSTEFQINFARQTEPGEYSLTIGPDIKDEAGNLMDQDGDQTNGEIPDDQFSTTITLVSTPPFEKHLDFGNAGSPVAPGYTAVSHSSNYSTGAGHGWLSGSIDSRDRGSGAGDQLTQDFNFTELATFAVDIPKSGFYDVTLKMGDGAGYGRDNMGVFLEGVQVDSVTTTGAEIATNTYRVEISDGQLTLRLEDLGGDPFVLLNGLDVVEAAPDTVGPRVVGTSPETEVVGSWDRIEITFDEAIDAATFSVEDIASFSGPGGAIAPTAVSPLGPKRFEITFPSQSTPGGYSFTLGPEIADLAGNLMDQDGDGTGGEASDDQYRTTITLSALPPFEKHLDFGTAGSPVASGYTAVFISSSYTPGAGHGWVNGSIGSRDRGNVAGNAVRRDFNFTDLATFIVDVPEAGIYDVTLAMGDGGGYGRDQMGVHLEGTLYDSITTTGAEIAVNTYQVGINDGQLKLVLDDLGGSDPYVILNGLDITEAAPDSSGPRVVSSSPDGPLSGPLDRITVTFDEGIDAATFTLDDVSLTGPNGAITPSQISQRTVREFEILFESQTAAGEYSLVLGPEISDVFGNPMNQDNDSVNGESADDRFQTTITLSPVAFEQYLDFGTSGSPVAPGHKKVLIGSMYSQQKGYGWLSSPVGSRDRGGSVGDAVSRDFNYLQFGTFVVDVPAAGQYDVTLTMGDGLGYGRDQMGIFLEGAQVDSVTTVGSQIAVNTYQVEVTDGQLTLVLHDLGGNDPYVLINGLEVAAAGSGQGTTAAAMSSSDFEAIAAARGFATAPPAATDLSGQSEGADSARSAARLAMMMANSAVQPSTRLALSGLDEDTTNDRPSTSARDSVFLDVESLEAELLESILDRGTGE